MKLEENKSNDLGNSKDKINEGEDGIRSRLRKNPNKTKYLYTGDLNDQKSKKKNDVPSAENVKEICRSILEVIKKDEKSILFRQPAIKSFSLQKDKDYYKKRIKEPRDLGYISKKLKLEEYTLKNFYDDMELCWSNALEFNDSNTEAYLCAVYLKELSNKLYKEKGIWDLINKEKDKEKETISNNNNSSNLNTNDSNTTPNKTPIKINKKEKNKDKTKKENDISEKTESISSNTNSNNKNTDSSYSSELKNNKVIGKKRKRANTKEEKNKEKSEEKEEKEKQSKKRGGRKKKLKESNNNLSTPQTKNKMSIEDIKKKFPINHQIVSGYKDLEKLLNKKRKKSSKNKSNDESSKRGHDNNNGTNNNKKKNKNNQNKSNIEPNSNTNNNNTSSLLQKEIRKACYEFMSEMLVNGTFTPNNLIEKSQQNNQNNSQKNEMALTPMKFRYKNVINEMANYDVNCNKEISYNKSSNAKNKKVMNELKNKINKNSQGMNNTNNNEIKNSNNNGNIPTKAPDKKEDKNMQLRIEIAKYFDILTDNDMINVLVFIENIRPQSLRVLQNDTIYIDMEAFNEETFKKVFECVRKYV